MPLRILLSLFLFSPKVVLLFARCGVYFKALIEELLQALNLRLNFRTRYILKRELRKALKNNDPLEFLDALIEREGEVRKFLAKFNVSEEIIERASEWIRLEEEQPVFVGQEQELNEMIGYLSRSQSVILLGNAGVGKTSLARAVPSSLSRVRLKNIYLQDALAGFSESQRKQFFVKLLAEVKDNQNIILFLDRLEQAKGQEQLLSQAISSGKLRLIATTTTEKFEQSFSSTELGQVLKKVIVKEPDFKTMLKIIQANTAALEKKHQVYFSYLSLVAIMEKAKGKDGFIPSRAMALLDKTAALVRRNRGKGALVLEEDVV